MTLQSQKLDLKLKYLADLDQVRTLCVCVCVCARAFSHARMCVQSGVLALSHSCAQRGLSGGAPGSLPDKCPPPVRAAAGTEALATPLRVA